MFLNLVQFNTLKLKYNLIFVCRGYLSITSGAAKTNTSSCKTSTKFRNITHYLSIDIKYSSWQRVCEESSSNSIGQLSG